MDKVQALEDSIITHGTGLKPRVSDLEIKVRQLDNDIKKKVPTKITAIQSTSTSTSGLRQPQQPPSLNAQQLAKFEQRLLLQESNMQLLTAWLHTMYRDHCALQKEVYFNKSKLHNNELLVGGIAEAKKQDNRNDTITFFKEKLGIEVADHDVFTCLQNRRSSSNYGHKTCYRCYS